MFAVETAPTLVSMLQVFVGATSVAIEWVIRVYLLVLLLINYRYPPRFR